MAADRTGAVSGGGAGQIDHDRLYGHADHGECQKVKKLDIHYIDGASFCGGCHADPDDQRKYEYGGDPSRNGGDHDLRHASPVLEIFPVSGKKLFAGSSVVILICIA